MKFKVYFTHADGTPDEIIVSGSTIKEVREQVDNEMAARNATYVGSEQLA